MIIFQTPYLLFYAANIWIDYLIEFVGVQVVYNGEIYSIIH